MVMKNFTVLPICIVLLFIRTSTSLESITRSQHLRDGETLVSSEGVFEMGFFCPGKSKNRYLGIWYKRISPLTVVWVANREAPISDGSGILVVKDQGILTLFDSSNRTVWSSNSSIIAEKPIVQLLDTGNLIISDQKHSNKDRFIWQSFDYPCDTLLPGMKLGFSLATGLNRFLSSWRSPDDPGQGEHMLKLDPRGYPQSFQLRTNVIHFRGGSWNGLYFTGYPVQKQNPVYKAKFVFNDKEAYYEYELVNSSVYSRITMSPSGIGKRVVWSNRRGIWEIISANMADQCDNYGLCGVYSICDFSSSRVCECLKGFVPKNEEQWNLSDWSGGCVRSALLDCNSLDGFRKYRGVKLPDTSSSQFNKTMSLEECQQSCFRKCSCTAYANLDIRNGGSGCLLWFNDLIDIKQLPRGGQDIFIRVLASELDFFENKHYGNINKRNLVGIAVGSVTINMGMILIIFGLIRYVWKRALKKSGMTKMYNRNPYYNNLRMEDTDLQIFDLTVLSKATNNFSSTNKLGEGGFGPVYKGALGNGQELAVKRLSQNSVQGLEEFKNEVLLIAKLQHRNLVKLLGCCIEREEKLLIYEYMPNKSLDHFIFDETRSKLLDWTKRFDIINGIARGLLYLHQDSRLRVIHRDLKTSNILLDTNLNPKISDFGLARTFWGDQIEEKTNRIAGTYGYMPPEYAVHGHFSIKSDVFSFGVIVLEIISGKKNREFSDFENFLNLLGYAWRLWREGMALELIDEALGERFNPSEVIQCIQVGLLCVQQRPEDRPDMSSVVLMLNGEKSLPAPHVPAFYMQREIHEADSSSEKCKPSSPNEMSLTIFEAR